MILTSAIAHGVASGEVTVAFRQWPKPRVAEGSTFRTVAGVVQVGTVEAVDVGTITEGDAHAVGFTSVKELTGTFRGDEDDPVFRIGLTWVGPDGRDGLAQDAELSEQDVADIGALLDKLDAHTPWARTTLRRIAAEPGIPSVQLAEELAMDKDSLKRRIRKLKERGLTRSLQVGYDISPRGRAFLDSDIV